MYIEKQSTFKPLCTSLTKTSVLIFTHIPVTRPSPPVCHLASKLRQYRYILRIDMNRYVPV